MKIISIIILLGTSLIAQPWYYDFGTGTGSHTTGESIIFLPDPQTGGGVDARVRIGSGGGSFNLEDQVIAFGSQSYIRGVASTSTSVNKFSIYDYTAGTSFTIRFTIRLGSSDGSATGAASGEWYIFIGNGATYSNNNSFSGAEVFTGLQWVFGASGVITTNYRNGSNWSSVSGSPFAQGLTYIVDIYGNNSAASINYMYGISQSVAPNTFDLWINGNLVGNDLDKALLTEGANIDSWMFYGINSTGNVANIFLDDIYYTNTIAETPLPVELSSFSTIILDNAVKLNWRTETEVSNYGFEIERLQDYNNEKLQDWEVLGFVEGHGNSNSPKEYSFTDDLTLNPDLTHTLSYRLKQIDTDGSFEYSKVIEIDLGSPAKFELSQNYPNPFNPVTTIRFTLPQPGNVKLILYNVLGEQVAELVNEFKDAGVHTINFNAFELNSGVYIYKLESNGFVQSRKMMLVK